MTTVYDDISRHWIICNSPQKNVENLLSSFAKIRRFYANELQNKLEKENLTPNEISILILLSNNPSVTTSSQLVYFLQVSKGLVSRSIDSLVKKGLIQCVQDDKDRRVQRIVLTPASKTITIKITNEVRKINDRILKDISEEEIIQMESTISKIIECFESKGGRNV